jgi:hypothetical protein
VNTGSVLLTQLMHISSTGALVVFSPHVAPGQEVMWYLGYGCLLWLLVTMVLVCTCGHFGMPTRRNIRLVNG